MNRFLSDDKDAAENPRGSQPHQNGNKTSRCFVPRRSRGVAAGCRAGRRGGREEPISHGCWPMPRGRAIRFHRQGTRMLVNRNPSVSATVETCTSDGGGSLGRCPFVQQGGAAARRGPSSIRKLKGKAAAGAHGRVIGRRFGSVRWGRGGARQFPSVFTRRGRTGTAAPPDRLRALRGD